MKKIGFILSVACLMFLTYACSNDFELVDEWKDIPVVYGLLSRSDSAHYIRVEKAFLDPDRSALEVAQIPDSLYYDNITVELVNMSNDQRFMMERVDGNLEGFEREAGVFADAPNYLYKVDSAVINLTENTDYQLVINRGDNLPLVTAQTTIVGDYEMIATAPANPMTWRYEEGRDFSLKFTWRSSETAAKFYDLSLILHYAESDPDNPNNFIPKELVWEVAKNLERPLSNGNPRPQISYDIPSESFYQFLASNIEVQPSLSRVFTSIDIVVNAGGTEIFDYISVGNSNTGITSSQVIPTYTNLSEGFGLFSSRNINFIPGYSISGETRDSLILGQYTKELNFR